MNARRSRGPRPGPAHDFRAVAADRPQRTLGLPVRTAGDALPDSALDDSADAVRIRLRRRDGGTAYVLVIASVVLERPADVRLLARRLDAAADGLEGGAP